MLRTTFTIRDDEGYCQVDQGLVALHYFDAERSGFIIPLRAIVWWEENVPDSSVALHLIDGSCIQVTFRIGDSGTAWSQLAEALFDAFAAA